MKKAFRAAGEICSWLLLVCMVVCIAALLITKLSGGVPQFFGYRIYVISTGSMEPALHVGDVILAKSFHNGDSLTPGEILTYEGAGETQGMLITHRLVSVTGEAGSRTLILRGDANSLDDAPVAETRLVSRTVCRLRLFGAVFGLMQSSFGMPILILILLVFIVIEILNFSKAVRPGKSDGDGPQNP